MSGRLRFAEHGRGQKLSRRAGQIVGHMLSGAEIGNGKLPFLKQADERRQRRRFIELREDEARGPGHFVRLENTSGRRDRRVRGHHQMGAHIGTSGEHVEQVARRPVLWRTAGSVDQHRLTASARQRFLEVGGGAGDLEGEPMISANIRELDRPMRKPSAAKPVCDRAVRALRLLRSWSCRLRADRRTLQPGQFNQRQPAETGRERQLRSTRRAPAVPGGSLRQSSASADPATRRDAQQSPGPTSTACAAVPTATRYGCSTPRSIRFTQPEPAPPASTCTSLVDSTSASG